METKIRTICIDTVTQIQENQFMTDKKKPGHDKWKDYSTELWEFFLVLQDLGFELLLVVGPPGTGKSSGIRTLPSNTNIWFNVDNKNPVWIGGKEEYGKKDSPRMPYHVIPKSYKAMIDHIKEGLNKGMFEEQKYAIIIGHTENFKEGAETRMRLKTLGNLNNKMQIEGKLESVFYSVVEMVDGAPEYILETQNNGYNTARSHMGAFEGKIPNDYKMVIDKLMEY